MSELSLPEAEHRQLARKTQEVYYFLMNECPPGSKVSVYNFNRLYAWAFKLATGRDLEAVLEDAQ